MRSCSVGVGCLVVLAGLTMPLIAGAVADPGARGSVPPKTADLALPAATSTIHWSIGKDGSVTLSDRPDPGAAQRGVQSFPSHSDPESLARAAKEREYWRAQAEAFSARQRDRDRELEQRRQVAVLSRDPGYGYAPYYAVGGYYRGIGLRHFPPGGIVPGPAFGQGAPFVQSNSAAPGQGPAPFLSSGFATGLRR